MEMTYKMIGGDGQEYGPTTLSELEGWVLEGRLLPATLVWSSETERWAEAARLPELAECFARILAPVKAAARSTAFTPAGAWRRLSAFLADTLVIYLIGSLVIGVILAGGGSKG